MEAAVATRADARTKSAGDTAISLKRLKKTFEDDEGKLVEVIRDITLDIRERESHPVHQIGATAPGTADDDPGQRHRSGGGRTGGLRKRVAVQPRVQAAVRPQPRKRSAGNALSFRTDGAHPTRSGCYDALAVANRTRTQFQPSMRVRSSGAYRVFRASKKCMHFLNRPSHPAPLLPLTLLEKAFFLSWH